jgi:hypothetical protein
MDDELEGIRKKAIMVCFKVLSRSTEENRNKL